MQQREYEALLVHHSLPASIGWQHTDGDDGIHRKRGRVRCVDIKPKEDFSKTIYSHSFKALASTSSFLCFGRRHSDSSNDTGFGCLDGWLNWRAPNAVARGGRKGLGRQSTRCMRITRVAHTTHMQFDERAELWEVQVAIAISVKSSNEPADILCTHTIPHRLSSKSKTLGDKHQCPPQWRSNRGLQYPL